MHNVPGPGLVIVMLTPIVAAGLLALPLRERYAVATPLRGLWLVPAVVVATILAARLEAAGSVDDAVANRLLALGVLVACAAFTRTNHGQPSRLVHAGVLLTTVGTASNALATLLYGYMPVLASSARWLGMDLTAGARPDPQYVGASASDVPALLVGDVLPVPELNSVVSLGDLLLIPGCTILLASVLVRLLPAPTDLSARADAREEVTR